MTNRIFRSIFLVALAVMCSVSVLIMGMMYQYSALEKRDELRREAKYIALLVESDGLSPLERIGAADNTRITWIGADGTVYFDSVAREQEMENHGDREEVREAFEK